MKNDWLTIPGFPNYEINGDFEVRNRKTKRLLTPGYYGFVKLYSNGVQYKRLPQKLRCLAESGNAYIVRLSRGSEVHGFTKKLTAARFLAAKTFYSESYANKLLAAQRTIIFGWYVEYVV